ncbi:MAG TPA: hypothetical protein VH085_08695 [Nocardioides sp.]|nr:hypothetical protein [Nocardioides sp.]
MNDKPATRESAGRWYAGTSGPGWYAPGPGERVRRHIGGEEGLRGTTIRFFWDYGCEMPLWGEHGNLPADPEWLARELGLSPALVADLVGWAESQELQPTVEGAQEDRLFRRIQDQLAEGLTVVRDS